MSAMAALHRAGARASLARLALGTALVAGFSAPAHAVFTFTGALLPPRQIALRVGSANATVNNVTFDVNSASLFLNPQPVTGAPGNGTPATAPAGGTEIQIAAQTPWLLFGSSTLTLTVDSSAGLSCVGGTGCGTTIIPFTTVSWTSYNKDTASSCAGQDIQNGTFTGGGSQQLAQCNVGNAGLLSGYVVTLSNVLVFQYSNATFYPAGQYTGRVVFTATNN
jgi:hypothetical protein